MQPLWTDLEFVNYFVATNSIFSKKVSQAVPKRLASGVASFHALGTALHLLTLVIGFGDLLTNGFVDSLFQSFGHVIEILVVEHLLSVASDAHQLFLVHL